MSDQQINSTRERAVASGSGGLLLLVFVALLAIGIAAPFLGARLLAIPLILAALCILMGFYTVQPNQSVALTVFGNYKGSDRNTGLRWVPFWYGRKKVSLRVRNVTSEALKVNDQRGNPIEIAANIVWHISDSAQALFDVDDYAAFVNIQIETALRETARQYAYDHAEDGQPTLREDAEIVSQRLKADLQTRVAVAGVSVDEAHLMHLAYAPEIAGAMLKRQQAEAIIAARQKIVAGAVGMVELALDQLSARGVVKLDEERKAAMVSNLLVVLCADREAQPVVNTGTLYG
ncbi:SPFH domain-containing protein [Asticcacaulis sp. 201]|uniref:SPFH domain-containing protein n=1 Tax=Asticcacaulis sp. 201 TaxID=3028787 RepID=UPI0029168D3E|nr:SPFH domain-containing protein [Asticcacaulis sp. 201]MDV6330067.1 SPFH domain-containing protein [Asticcacaulis sp. 201]